MSYDYIRAGGSKLLITTPGDPQKCVLETIDEGGGFVQFLVDGEVFFENKLPASDLWDNPSWTIYEFMFNTDVEIKCSESAIAADCEKRLLDILNMNNFKGEVVYNIPQHIDILGERKVVFSQLRQEMTEFIHALNVTCFDRTLMTITVYSEFMSLSLPKPDSTVANVINCNKEYFENRFGGGYIIKFVFAFNDKVSSFSVI